MFMRVIQVLCLSIIAVAAVADDSLWNKLQHDANMVVLMRNAESDGNRGGSDMLVWDASGACKGESTLTAEGKAQAESIGSAFVEHGISPTVISSPMCRCTETAQIAFGGYITDPGLRQRPASDIPGQEAFQASARAMLRQYRGITPVVFVNHRPNIDSLTMELLDLGELLIGRISDDGEIEVLGKIRIDPGE
ncbi:MAG TPA: histidine phosphatase family protein [Gammaproteobacteria bacterium]|nr:histidine phosphatase family protein [Gammaproteobacteria bacterium]